MSASVTAGGPGAGATATPAATPPVSANVQAPVVAPPLPEPVRGSTPSADPSPSPRTDTPAAVARRHGVGTALTSVRRAKLAAAHHSAGDAGASRARKGSGASVAETPPRSQDASAATHGESLPAWPPLPFDVMNLGNTDAGGSSSGLLLFALMLAFVVLALPALGPQLPLRSPRLRAARLLRRLERPG